MYISVTSITTKSRHDTTLSLCPILKFESKSALSNQFCVNMQTLSPRVAAIQEQIEILESNTYDVQVLLSAKVCMCVSVRV
jgi:hypothetical protein